MRNIMQLVVVGLLLLSPWRLGAAESVYTWTDEKGVLHITDRKPKDDASIQDVIRYEKTEPAPENKAAQKKMTGTAVQAADSEQKQARIERAEKDLAKAEDEARKAWEHAQKTRKLADDFRDKIGNKKKMWNKNKPRLKALEDQAQAAEERARTAEDVARAAREAVSALQQPAAPAAAGQKGAGK